jgi:hypothetical protein
MKKMGLLCVAVVGSGLVLAGPASARRATSTRRHACAVPAGARLVAQDSAARIVVIHRTQQGTGGTDNLQEWRYCLRRSGGYRSLVTGGSYASGAGDSVGVGPVVLAGQWSAWATTTIQSGGRYHAPIQGTVSVRYLGGPQAKMTYEPDSTCGAFRQLVLSPTGIAAWEAELCLYPMGQPPTYMFVVQAINGRTGKNVTLDSTPASQSNHDPFTSLQLTSCVAGCTPPGGTAIWWQHDGLWHSAPAP